MYIYIYIYIYTCVYPLAGLNPAVCDLLLQAPGGREGVSYTVAYNVMSYCSMLYYIIVYHNVIEYANII